MVSFNLAYQLLLYEVLQSYTKVPSVVLHGLDDTILDSADDVSLVVA